MSLCVTEYRNATDTRSRNSKTAKLVLGGLCVGTALAAAAWIGKEAQARMAAHRGNAFREESMHDTAPRTIDGLPLDLEEGVGAPRPLSAPLSVHSRSEEEARWAEPRPVTIGAGDTFNDDSLREHDFPALSDRDTDGIEAVTREEGAQDPEKIELGGKLGKVKGDKQKRGEAPTIMDQRESTPDFAQQFG